MFRAALVVAAGWAVTLAVWYFARGDLRLALYAAIDAAQAGYFFYLSRGKYFPVPLFFLYGALVLYHSWAALIGAPPGFIAAFLNRAFELALVYVMGCALFRISRLRAKKGTPIRARLRKTGDREI